MAHQRYGEASYWNDRYTKDPEIFDWYQVLLCVRGVCGLCGCVRIIVGFYICLPTSIGLLVESAALSRGGGWGG